MCTFAQSHLYSSSDDIPRFPTHNVHRRYRKSAEGGNNTAQIQLAICLSKGRGAPRVLLSLIFESTLCDTNHYFLSIDRFHYLLSIFDCRYLHRLFNTDLNTGICHLPPLHARIRTRARLCFGFSALQMPTAHKHRYWLHMPIPNCLYLRFHALHSMSYVISSIQICICIDSPLSG